LCAHDRLARLSPAAGPSAATGAGRPQAALPGLLGTSSERRPALNCGTWQPGRPHAADLLPQNAWFGPAHTGGKPSNAAHSGSVSVLSGHIFTQRDVLGRHRSVPANGQGSAWLNDINPGNTVHGRIAFDMPSGDKAMKIELHDSMLSDGVTVRLS
jgi:hypothetical protein